MDVYVVQLPEHDRMYLSRLFVSRELAEQYVHSPWFVLDLLYLGIYAPKVSVSIRRRVSDQSLADWRLAHPDVDLVESMDYFQLDHEPPTTIQ